MEEDARDDRRIGQHQDDGVSLRSQVGDRTGAGGAGACRPGGSRLLADVETGDPEASLRRA